MAVYHLLERQRASAEGTKVLTATISPVHFKHQEQSCHRPPLPPAPVAKLLSAQEQNALVVSGAVFCAGSR